jgi:hypothetical protein
VERARAVLADVGRFWEEEREPEKRRELVAQLIERVWIDNKRVVAIRPTPAFKPFFACNGQRKQETPRLLWAGGRATGSNPGFRHRSRSDPPIRGWRVTSDVDAGLGRSAAWLLCLAA